MAANLQIFEGPRPEIEVAAHAYEGSAADVLGQLRDVWDAECTSFEETDSPTPYRSERIDTVAAPDGVEAAHWAADCAEVTLLDGGTGGIAFCSALVAVGEHVILDLKLSGLQDETERYRELLGAIAAEVLTAQG